MLAIRHFTFLRHLILVLFAVGLAWTSPAPPEQVNDPALGLTMQLPTGFSPAPEIMATDRTVLHAFRRAGPPGEGQTIVYITKLRSVIGRERLKASDMPAGANAKLLTTAWKGFEVDVIELHESLLGKDIITYNVQIPLKPNAIQLSVAGPAANSTELWAIVNSTLATLNGPSNWTPSVVPASFTKSPAYGLILLGIALVFLIAGLLVLWFIGRRAPKGVVVGIATFAYLLSWSIPHPAPREFYMVSGTLRMFGVIGIILGIIDLCKKRPSAQTSPPVIAPPVAAPQPAPAAPPRPPGSSSSQP